MDPFASHVIRALLSLLCPHLFPQDVPAKSSHVRSKKSAVYKAKQGSMKSVFTSPSVQLSSVPVKTTPPEFKQTAGTFVTLLRDILDDNEVRALAANQVASPVLQVFDRFILQSKPLTASVLDALGSRGRPTNERYPWLPYGPRSSWINHNTP